MEWWIYLIIAYCVATYFLGAFICLLYVIGNYRSASQHKVKLKDMWGGIFFYALISPIFVPWWLVEFVKENQGE